MNPMKLFAVTGRPILRSRSPGIFNAAFAEQGLSARYTRLASETAGQALDLFERIGLSGLNVTAPFKLDIVSRLSALDPIAEKVGAVNTVVREGGGLKGYNTDAEGVVRALDGAGAGIGGRKALVFGAGGAGRAAAFALLGRNAEVTILDRNRPKADAAAAAIGCAADSLDRAALHVPDASIIVTTIPPRSFSLDALPVHSGQVLFEASYGNEALARAATGKGLRAVRGEEWLKGQAVPAYRLFVGRDMPEENMDWPRLLRPSPAEKRDAVALVGFMGSGKSEVGRGLAAKLGYDFLDLDERIESRTGISVPDIFRKHGEAYFRNAEKEALAELASSRRLVLACGGGVVLDEDNRRRLAGGFLVVWIVTDLETIFKRAGDRGRPMLHHPAPLDRARELWDARGDRYALGSDLIVSNEGPLERTIGTIDAEIHSAL